MSGDGVFVLQLAFMSQRLTCDTFVTTKRTDVNDVQNLPRRNKRETIPIISPLGF
jgi:hypothetical protein